ncbi:hypothetical protein, partial [Roseateles sp.]|uniref:hypothetical protein n=1 Tax=Roseateles sp. TaxID=1971397 RepID=UPI003BA42DC2
KRGDRSQGSHRVSGLVQLDLVWRREPLIKANVVIASCSCLGRNNRQLCPFLRIICFFMRH